MEIFFKRLCGPNISFDTENGPEEKRLSSALYCIGSFYWCIFKWNMDYNGREGAEVQCLWKWKFKKFILEVTLQNKEMQISKRSSILTDPLFEKQKQNRLTLFEHASWLSDSSYVKKS